MEKKELETITTTTNSVYYTHVCVCSNCHTTNTISIPKGTRIDKFLLTQKCQYCGCSIKDTSTLKFD